MCRVASSQRATRSSFPPTPPMRQAESTTCDSLQCRQAARPVAFLWWSISGESIGGVSVDMAWLDSLPQQQDGNETANASRPTCLGQRVTWNRGRFEMGVDWNLRLVYALFDFSPPLFDSSPLVCGTKSKRCSAAYPSLCDPARPTLVLVP